MQNGRLWALGLLTSLLLPVVVALGASEPQGSQWAPPLVTPEPPKWEDQRLSTRVDTNQAFEAKRARGIIDDLPPDASVEEVELALFDLLPQIYRATNGDLPVVTEVLASLRQQPGAVEAMARQYRQLPVEAFEQRLVVIGILGEMQRPDAMAQLREVVWAPLPPAESSPEGLSSRDLEEMIQAKAAQGLAYMATQQADEIVLELIESHEALHVRVSAIDAYMWNHGDNPETAAELFELLPIELHPYVERPRFHRHMDPTEFTRRLHAWRERWSNQSLAPRTLTDDHNGSEK